MFKRVCVHTRAPDSRSAGSHRNCGGHALENEKLFTTVSFGQNLVRVALMIIYSVTITIEESIESEWVEWMNSVHVPDVLRTGCFSECRIYRILGSDAVEPIYVLQYQCRSIEEYHRYRDNFAPALQKEHTDRFAGRFRGSRQLLEEIVRVESSPAL
jgi:Domain of unknown function (DUF4286)